MLFNMYRKFWRATLMDGEYGHGSLRPTSLVISIFYLTSNNDNNNNNKIINIIELFDY